MSNKSGTAGQILSLPKGGGALRGIGETFSPDLHTGTGNFTVPIALPPGRGGLQPELSLVYSTGHGTGPCGLGWSLSVPGICRQTSRGVPRYDDAQDVFVLSGAEDLVPVKTQGAATHYRPRTEGLFARISHHRGTHDDYWEVRSRDGLVSRYGTAGRAGTDPAVVADPSKRDHVFAWKLTETRDPFGNRILYEYERDTGQDGPHHWDQLYLKRIRYADYNDASGAEHFLISVTFVYQDLPEGYPGGVADNKRVYPSSSYRTGFEIRTRKRCKRIVVLTHAGQERPVRTYTLVYLDERAGLEARLPRNGTSLLSQFEVTGHDGQDTETLPPLTFSYTQFTPENADLLPLEGELPATSLASPDLEMADLFGNGLPDLLQMNGTVRYWRNLGGGQFDVPRSMPDAPAGLQLADAGVRLLDADGDGRVDLLATVDGLSGYFPLRFDGQWDRRSFQRYRQAPSFNLEDPEVKLVDLTGDGVPDAVRSGTRMTCFFNDPKEGWNGTRPVERRAMEDFPDVTFSDARVKWADLSGDGLQDVVLVYDGNVEYWPNLGHGTLGKRIHMHDSPRFPYGYDPRRILVDDVDGDGLADLVYVDDTRVTVWINQNGNGWSDPIEIDGTPPVSDLDAVRLTDLLGTGVGGVLWSRDADVTRRAHYFFLDLTGAVKPYLLREMDNHVGAVTRVRYKPSTHFFLEDAKRRETRWKTPLPFPVQVVAGVEVIDAVSGGKLTTEYRYHHGYWDGAEREFRGFGRVDQMDTETFDRYNQPGLHAGTPFAPVLQQEQFSPPLETRTWFHQGPVGDGFGEWEETNFSEAFWAGDPQRLERPAAMASFLKGLPRRAKRDALRTLRGRILRTELYALDGTARAKHPYTVTEYLHGLREEAATGAGEKHRPRIFFPHTLAQRTTQWERGDDPMTQFRFTEDYDAYGQPRTQTQIACPRGWQDMADTPGKPYLATRSTTVFAGRDDTQVYIVDRVARTTGYEIVNQGAETVLALQDTPDDSGALRVIGQAFNYYDGAAFQGLPFEQVGLYGALVRSETLILTPDLLQEAYGPDVPPYYDAAPAWTSAYPPAFRTLKPRAGYTYYAGGPGDEHVRGYFASSRQKYDVHDAPADGRGLPVVNRDALGNDTTIAYDAYDLLPARVTDPAGLVTQAEYDYRVLQPKAVSDPNGDRTIYTFTPLGLLKDTAVLGKPGDHAGDTPDKPGTRFAYDFAAFEKHGQPISVRTLRRVHHAGETDVPLPEREETIEAVEYSDGFGRLVQTRTQAENLTFGAGPFGEAGLPAGQDAPNQDAVGRTACPGGQAHVVVSGWQIYDNKGRVVEQYEPFFACGWGYTTPSAFQRGRKMIMFYDPRGQVVCTRNPDGSEQRVIYGVPGTRAAPDLTDPEVYEPTPWEVYTYDENDNAGRTHAGTAHASQHAWNTPSSAVVDALGRTVETVERNRTRQTGGSWSAVDAYKTTSTYDIRGNVLTVVDALGRTAFRYAYDLTPAGEDDEEGASVLRLEQLDAGVRRVVFDARGSEIERRDSKGALLLQAYDALGRPLRLWARDGTNEPVTLREHLVYGDSAEAGLTPVQARIANLLGKLYRHYDEAGRLTFSHYDFKGNILEKTRQVIRDAALMTVFSPPPPGWSVPAFRMDWQPAAGTTLGDHALGLLDATAYPTSMTYDALNRVKMMRYPPDADGARKTLRPHYNRAGALERVTLDGTTYVQHIAYNAKGQRTLIAYGGGVMTRYAYDADTFRLARLRTERYTYNQATGQASTHTYHPTGAALQDFGYTYDRSGNILRIADRTPGCGIPGSVQGTDALDRAFTYDPLDRLVAATGRECDHPPPAKPWTDPPRCHDVTRTRAYTQAYAYDRAGNLARLQHTAGPGSFTRAFTLAPGTNRLQSLAVGGTTCAYTYDAAGNLTRENTARHFEWDHSDRMRVFRNQVGGSEPTLHAQYLYGSDGQRVKKLIRKPGGQVEVTVYVDGVFEHRRLAQAGAVKENTVLHVMDDAQRIALVRVGPPLASSDTSPPVQYYLGDHLGSSNLVVKAGGAWINREEFTPYGETSFGGFSKKRYRFTGKERDGESGLNYHGARYYAPWLGRWVSCDPVVDADVQSPYTYVLSNPANDRDPDGAQPESRQDQAASAARQMEEDTANLGRAPTARHMALETLFPTLELHRRPQRYHHPALRAIYKLHGGRKMTAGINRIGRRGMKAALETYQYMEMVGSLSTTLTRGLSGTLVSRGLGSAASSTATKGAGTTMAQATSHIPVQHRTVTAQALVALRRLGTAQAHAVAKLIKRGRLSVQAAVLSPGRGGEYRWDRILRINFDYFVRHVRTQTTLGATVQQLGRTLAHEGKHAMDHLMKGASSHTYQRFKLLLEMRAYHAGNSWAYDIQSALKILSTKIYYDQQSPTVKALIKFFSN